MLLNRLFQPDSSYAAVAFRHARRLAWTQLAFVCGIASAQPALTLRVASEAGPAGGWAQIKVFADAPALIGRGVLAIDLDATFFGPIAGVSTFSAAGDATGFAIVSGTHAEITITASSGGIGQLPNVPVFVARAPILPTASGRGFISLSVPEPPPSFPGSFGDFPYPEGIWADAAGNSYTTTYLSGSYQPSNFMPSVQSITPGGGLHAPGTVLHIDGTGFGPATKVSAPGLAFSNINVVSATRIDATLATSSELTGVRFRIGSDSSPVDFFSAAPSAVGNLDPLEPVPYFQGKHVILPLNQRKSMNIGGTQSAWTGLLQNTSGAPIQVLVKEINAFGVPLSGRRERRELSSPAGARPSTFCISIQTLRCTWRTTGCNSAQGSSRRRFCTTTPSQPSQSTRRPVTLP
ncbi:MAG: hypothetical protein ABI995_13010 [Acidobacteriota bacterium]